MIQRLVGKVHDEMRSCSAYCVNRALRSFSSNDDDDDDLAIAPTE